MLTINKPRDKFGVQLQGDFFDFDRLYFAIFKLTRHDFYQVIKKQKKNRIFQNCDVDTITNIMASYYEKTPEKDNLDLLLDTLSLLLRPLP